jgi:hypothetical protein
LETRINKKGFPWKSKDARTSNNARRLLMGFGNLQPIKEIGWVFRVTEAGMIIIRARVGVVRTVV